MCLALMNPIFYTKSSCELDVQPSNLRRSRVRVLIRIDTHLLCIFKGIHFTVIHSLKMKQWDFQIFYFLYAVSQWKCTYTGTLPGTL